MGLNFTKTFLFLLCNLASVSHAWVQFNRGESFYWQLKGRLPAAIKTDVVDIDLEDNERTGLVQKFKAQGKKVICYFSAGTYEDWRKDKNQFPQANIGAALADWPGERWLDIRQSSVRQVIARRIDRAVALGCDAVEPDNVDGYQNKNGLGLTDKDQVSFLRWMAKYAHSKNMAIGLKNALDLIKSANLQRHFDFAVNERCFENKECSKLTPFSDSGKAVFVVEYKASRQHCGKAQQHAMTLGEFNRDLDGRVFKPCE